MNFLKNMDLYKAIILGALLLMPLALGFVFWVNGEVDRGNRAIAMAKKRKGEIEQIGSLQRQLEKIARNVQSGGQSEDHRLYFEKRIIGSVSDGDLKASDFQIGNQVPRRVSKLKAVDQTVDIDFRREGKELPLGRSFIQAVLFNCEIGGAQVWKLRELQVRNVEAANATRSRTAPPKTVEDLWLVKKLIFARREPDKR